MRSKITDQEGVLVGRVFTDGELKGTIKSEVGLIGSVSVPDQYKDYIGDYEIVPDVDGLELETRDRHMVDNVRIMAIPYAEVSNSANGITVTIGK